MAEKSKLGKKIREHRQAHQLTLVQLSESCNISPSFLSQIERNQATPSVATLYAIAGALGVSTASFFSEPQSIKTPKVSKAQPRGGKVVRGDCRKKLIYPGTNIVNELLSPDLQGSLQMMWVVMPPGTDSGDDPFTHEGEECGVILQGQLEARVGDEKFILGPGDSIYHNSLIPHSSKNIGDSDVIMVVAKTPPSI
ncbi:MAG: cupin domain-containing protein [Anaerolineales bacterium]